MCVLLGGRMAEAVTFNRISTGWLAPPSLSLLSLLLPPSISLTPITGAADDLQKVTQLAYRQVAEAGMSEQVGHISFPSRSEVAGRRPYSKWLAAQIDREVCVCVCACTCACSLPVFH